MDHVDKNSRCTKNIKCTKKIPRNFIEETQPGNDGYPSYRRRSPDNDGRKTIMKLKNEHVEIRNRWAVQYNPLLSMVNIKK